MRFKTKHYTNYNQDFWAVVDSLDNDEPLFGDGNPKTEEEANQQARAANIAANIILSDITTKILPDIYISIGQLSRTTSS